MDPTVSIPLHFTVEIIGTSAAGLLLAWAVMRERWIAASGAFVLVVAQAAHAGRFLGAEDSGALIALRLVGLVLIAFDVARLAEGAPIVGSSLAAFGAGVVWGALQPGRVDEVAIGPHILIALGSVVLIYWVWSVSQSSVRGRVLTAFIAVLAIAIVVAGGAVTRAASLDKRNEQLRDLGSAAVEVRAELTDIGNDLARRSAEQSPRAGASSLRIDNVTLAPKEGALSASPNGVVSRLGAAVPDDVAVAAARTVTDGRTHVTFYLAGSDVLVVGSAPVFRPGGTQVAADVIGAVLITRTQELAPLRALAQREADDAEVVFRRGGDLLGATGNFEVPRDLTVSGMSVRFEAVSGDEGTFNIAITTLPGGSVGLIVAAPAGAVLDAATGLMRALLLSILTAALLAVVIALWLSTRITRPMLDLADEAERVKSEFLASVSHELRTPLTPIRGYTEILRRGRVPARRATGYLDEIGQAAQRLERIVTLLVDVAAMEAKRFPISRQPTAVEPLLEDAAARWSGRSARHTVTVTIDKPVPDVNCDLKAIDRVLDELLDNAVKFSPDGGRIELAAKKVRSGVEISLADAGVGMEADQADGLGQAFEQADSADTRRFGGLGLGLSFSAGVLDAHDSRLRVRSAIGEGTTVSFVLPVAGSVTRMTARAGKASSRAGGTPAPPGSRRS